VIGLIVFTIVSSILSSRLDPRIGAWSGWAMIMGLAAARFGHVVENAANFAAEPWRIFAVWQGGFSWLWAAVAVAASSAILLRTRRAILGSVVTLVAAVFSWNLVWQLASATPATSMPGLVMDRIGASPISLAPANGSPAVVNLWASWCPPCRREMPMMAELAATAKDVTFLFVNQGEGRSVIETYLTSQKLALSNVLLDPHRQVARHYGMPGLPATLFIGADGRLKSVHIGEISREALTAAIEQLTGPEAE
jgi:thiol-disulfide isomerase/thioredoxin